MSIADLAMGLLGGGDPRDKLAAAMAYQRNPADPMARAAWQKASGQPATAAPVDATTGGSGGSVPTAAPVPGAPGTPAGQQPPPPPPQPQAYTSPPDMVALYTEAMKRGQIESSLDRNIGLLAAGFAHPENRANIIDTMNAQATVDQNAFGPQMIQGAQTVSDQMQTAQTHADLMARLPALAQQPGMPSLDELRSMSDAQIGEYIKQVNEPDQTMKEYAQYVKQETAAGRKPVDLATFREKFSSTGREKLGLQMQWQAKTDADGNITLHGYQLGDRGTLHEVLDKDGQPLTAKPVQINTGTEIQFINPYTQEVVGRKPIDVAGKTLQEQQAKKAMTLPESDEITNRGSNLIDQIIADVDSGKGDFVGNTGLRNRFGEANVFSTTGHTASQLEQLKDIDFLGAYTSLRGAGNISDTEGVKAQNAFAALRHPEWLTPVALRDNILAAKQALQDANAAAHKAAGDIGNKVTSGGGDGSGDSGGGDDAIAKFMKKHGKKPPTQ